MTSTATEKSAKTARVTIEDLKDDYLECRDLRHMWGRAADWSTTRNTSGSIIEFTRVVICRRCRAERHETYRVPSMEVVKRKYVYPEKFLLHDPNHAGRPDVRDIRREVFKRIYVSAAG